jgi:hypothetical protein
MNRALPPLALAAAVLLAAPAAHADSVDAAARATARKLGAEAVKLFEAGDYAGALEKFNTADSLVPAPTLGLYAARCYVKLGKLVEASERYLEVTRMQLDRAAPPVMRKAQVDAVAEREKLLPTIPTLEVQLAGPVGEGVAVTVDDKALLPALLGEKRPINPGAHTLAAKRADTTITQQVSVSVGEPARVVLKLPPLPPAPAARMPPLHLAGWAGIGVAGAGVITGGVAGLVALAKGQSLLTQCPQHVCPDSKALALAGSYDTARFTSTAGFIVGAVGLAAGIPLLVFTPSVEYVYPDGRPAPPPAQKAHVEPWVTWGGAGVRGIF